MPITPNQLPGVTEFYGVGTTQVLFVAAISTPSAPTYAELDGGTELTPQMADIAGFTVNTNQIDVPNWRDRFTSQIPGKITAESSSITMYADPLGADARTLMPRDTSGYIVIADGGLAAAKGHVFPVKVSAVAPLRSADNAHMLRFDFSITDQPSENVTLPQS